MNRFRQHLRFAPLMTALLAGFSVISAGELFVRFCRGEDFSTVFFIRGGNLPAALLGTSAAAVLLFFAGIRWGSIIPQTALFCSLFGLSAILLYVDFSAYTYAFCILLLAASFYFLWKTVPRGALSEKKLRGWGIAAGAAGVILYAGVLGIIALYRVWSYTCVCFDFGIFCQMFHSMATDFSQSCSCERNQLLQHFAVHISPIYYLILPFYMLWQTPEMLNLLQVAITLSSALPLYLLAKRKGLRGAVPGLLTAAFLLYAPLAAGTVYDLHENCFLTPILLFLFYFYERDSLPGMAICSLLLCSVKEDAAFYLVAFALYILCSLFRETQKSLRTRRAAVAVCMIVLGVAWFLIACKILESSGLGVMTDRFSNLTGGEDSLLAVVCTALRNPAVFLRAVFNDGEKFEYALYLFVPLCGIPLLCKKPERLLLLVPALLYHFLSDYPYQHQLYFQYAYGTVAFIAYLCILNLSEEKGTHRTPIALFSLAASLLLFCGTLLPRLSYVEKYEASREEFAQVTEILESIPSDASVSASTCYCVPLSNREILYNLDRNERDYDTDYFVLDLRYENGQAYYEEFTSLGLHEMVAYVPEYLAVFQK